MARLLFLGTAPIAVPALRACYVLDEVELLDGGLAAPRSLVTRATPATERYPPGFPRARA